MEMRPKIILYLFCISFFPVLGQDDFQFEAGVDKVVIPFKMINNLIFIPIKVNGIELNFLLDSGVDETILFSMDEKKEVNFYNVEKISLRGLGSKDAVEGLKSKNNTLNSNGLIAVNHVVYIILDQTFNLSYQIGIPVNGIIGYKFLKSNLVEINYQRKRITVYRDNVRNRKRIAAKHQTIPITIEKSKPYIQGNVYFDSSEIPVKLLIDIGNSDAIWLFQNREKAISIPIKNFDDYLGRGFSGDVEGKRAFIKKFTFSKFEFMAPIVSFPDSTSIKNVLMVKGRSGSIGAEILKRFNLVFDYQKQLLYVKKNRNFGEPFCYNKSGLEIQNNGLQWVQETLNLETVPSGGTKVIQNGLENWNNFKYKFVLKPTYIIGAVRKNSLAANCGLQKEDVLISINKKPACDFTLEKINSLLKSEEENWINLEVERDNQILNFRFKLLNVL